MIQPNIIDISLSEGWIPVSFNFLKKQNGIGSRTLGMRK